jgi:hypothetical protein
MKKAVLPVTFLALLLGATEGWSAEDRFYRFEIRQDELRGAPDFGFLNRPLAASDRIFVRDGRFMRVGADLKPNTRDDERVRFFGTNAVFGGAFPEEKDAVRIARRLRRLGVNLVRLHHMDSSPDKDPQQARSILTTDPYPTLNRVSVGRLRAFLNALKAEGIYVNLNLHVGYTFRPAVDKVPAMPEGVSFPTQSKPLHVFYPRMVELQLEFTRRVIDALGLRGDPVLAMVEINNESSLVDSWQRGGLDRAAQGEYRAELQRQWNAYLKARYQNTEALSKAWGGVPPGQSLEQGNLALVTSKEVEPPARANDYIRFLAEKDREYLRRMRDAAKERLDALVPVTGTQMGFGGVLNLDTHADLDYIDHHFYIDHYNFPNQSWDARDWRIRDSSAVGSGLSAFLNVAVGRERGRPYTVSEFNQNWPNRHAAEIVPALAAFGAFQDWDSIMHFAYSHGREWDTRLPSGFDLNGDWTKYVNFGQAALLFRTAVRPARQWLQIPISEAMRLQFTRERRNGAIARGLEETVQYDPRLALLHAVALVRREGAAWKAVKAPEELRSDTGELYYSPSGRVLTIDTPLAAGVIGFTGTKAVSAGVVEVQLAERSRGFVTLLVTSLDQKPLGESTRMLLTIPGYVLATQPSSDPPRPQRFILYPGTADWWTLEPEPGSTRPSGNRGGGAPPAWMEQVECQVTLRTKAANLTVYPLDGAGQRLRALGADAVVKAPGGGFRIHLQAEGQDLAPWYEIVRP